jgi:hypothetical protein
MSTKYKATMPDTGYFVTITIVGCCGHGLQIHAIGNIHSKVKLPKGVYNILAVAIDWGGGRNIGVKINSGKLFGTDGYKSGPFDVGVYQVNEGKVLGKITVK